MKGNSGLGVTCHAEFGLHGFAAMDQTLDTTHPVIPKEIVSQLKKSSMERGHHRMKKILLATSLIMPTLIVLQALYDIIPLLGW
jgi:rRNA-processing protein FCF1